MEHRICHPHQGITRQAHVNTTIDVKIKQVSKNFHWTKLVNCEQTSDLVEKFLEMK